MIFDGLVVPTLPTTSGPPLPTPWWDQIPRLLFEGERTRRGRECSLHAGTVLARSYSVLRNLKLTRLSIQSDAEELLASSIVPEEWGENPVWAERLPPAWTRSPAAFVLSARWDGDGLYGALHLRYSPRCDQHDAPLTGSLRLLWAPPTEELLPRLTSTFLESDASVRLSRALLAQGTDRMHRLIEAFGGGYSHGAILVLSGPPARYPDFLRGFEPEETAILHHLPGLLHGSWPALSPEGVHGSIRNGQFDAGSSHAV